MEDVIIELPLFSQWVCVISRGSAVRQVDECIDGQRTPYIDLFDKLLFLWIVSGAADIENGLAQQKGVKHIV